MKPLVISRPYPKQMDFFHSTCKYTCYGGARGGGKSWAARIKAVLLCFNYPGIRAAFTRRTLTDLRENHIIPLKIMLDGIARYNGSEKAFDFPNGSRMVMLYYDNDGHATNWQGQAFDVIFIEEATQFREEWFNVIVMTNRSSGFCRKKFNPRIYLTCNPGGEGHAWVKRLFIDRKYRPDERAEDYCMIRATVDDNPYLLENSPDYVRILDNLPETLRRAMRFGDWDVFEGQFFTEFSVATHVVPPMDIPRGWRRYIALDYGLDMLAVYWIAVDYDGRAWVYRELTEGKDKGDGAQGLIVSAAAEAIKAYNDHDVTAILAPPDLWNRHKDSGRSTADIFAECGLPLIEASNRREQGWLDMREWLKIREDGKPGLLICSNCTYLIESLPVLVHDEKHVNDVASEPHEFTHGADAIRYFCAGRPFGAERAVQREEDYISYDDSISNFVDYSGFDW